LEAVVGELAGALRGTRVGIYLRKFGLSVVIRVWIATALLLSPASDMRPNVGQADSTRNRLDS
jgi:hypothetical protein